MKVITNVRSDYVNAIKQIIKPFAICTFSHIEKPEKFGLKNPQVIINGNQFKRKQIHYPSDWNMRTNNSIHAKIAIGKRYCMIGSWNMSDNSTQNMHEIALIINRAINTESYNQIRSYFETLWERSTEVKK